MNCFQPAEILPAHAWGSKMVLMPSAAIFSRSDVLSLHLAETLLAKGCTVIVVTDDKASWAASSSHLKENHHFIIANSSADLPEPLDYSFIKEQTSEVLGKKSLLILPYYLNGQKDVELLRDFEKLAEGSGGRAKVIFVGEVYGPRMNFALKGPVAKMLSEALRGQSIMLPPQNLEVFPVFAQDAAKELLRFIFSYGLPENGILVSQKKKIYDLAEELQQAKPDISFVYDATPESFAVHKVSSIRLPKETTPFSLKLTIDWIREKKPSPAKLSTISVPSPKLSKPKLPSPSKLSFPRKKLILAGVFAAFLALSLPFISIFVSGLTLQAAFGEIQKGEWERAKTYISVGATSARFGKSGFIILSKFPVLGRGVAWAGDAANVLEKGAAAGVRSVKVHDISKEIFEGVFSDKDYDLRALSQNLSLELDILYQEISFLQGEVGTFPQFNFVAIRSLIEGSRVIAHELPTLLGADKKVSYMVLLQNNMELRPTGGFIGSFALLGFDKGKFTDFEVLDVYSADGQLKGHVEPPRPIKDYLGEANWFLRDSNWDPDFPTSASRAEWFLEKEIERAVDGVIALDLEVASDILKETGELKLEDYGETIDHRNLYEKVQYEVEEGFFPGSRKKANFLTALSRALLERLTAQNQKDYLKLGKVIFHALEERHLQVYLHAERSQKVINSLGFDGSVAAPVCEGNCAKIWFGEVEANLGVNKTNYFIKRSLSFSSEVSSDKLVNRLSIILENTAPPLLGPSQNYKPYIRVFADKEASFKDVEVIGSEGSSFTHPEVFRLPSRLDAGIVVGVLPGEKKEIIFSWEENVNLDFTRPGQMIVFIRKQAGVGEDPININISAPSLASRSPFRYNTTLDKDFISEVSW